MKYDEEFIDTLTGWLCLELRSKHYTLVLVILMRQVWLQLNNQKIAALVFCFVLVSKMTLAA